MRNLILFIIFMMVTLGVNAQTQWIYNYSNIPIAPVVQPQPQVNYQQLHNYINNYTPPAQQYRVPVYAVIQSGGQMAICATFNNITTCY